MSLDKAIEKGREHRKPYRGAQAIARTCRNHAGKGKRHSGGECPYCLGNRMYQTNKEILRTEQEKVVYFNGEPVCNDGFNGEGFTSTAAYDQYAADVETKCTAPDCLDCERNDECNHIGLFEEVSEWHRQ